MALGSGRKPDFTDEETEKNYTGSGVRRPGTESECAAPQLCS